MINDSNDRITSCSTVNILVFALPPSPVVVEANGGTVDDGIEFNKSDIFAVWDVV